MEKENFEITGQDAFEDDGFSFVDGFDDEEILLGKEENGAASAFSVSLLLGIVVQDLVGERCLITQCDGKNVKRCVSEGREVEKERERKGRNVTLMSSFVIESIRRTA